MQTEEEIAELENDIRGIEEKIRAKIAPMKLAQTRLENRTYRPNVELCRDAPQYGLTDEVKQLEATKRALEEKLKQAKYVAFHQNNYQTVQFCKNHFSDVNFSWFQKTNCMSY